MSWIFELLSTLIDSEVWSAFRSNRLEPSPVPVVYERRLGRSKWIVTQLAPGVMEHPLTKRPTTPHINDM